MNCFVCVDKPLGPSSFDIVRKVRRMFRIRRVGHAGTLDPQASGLLVLALGKATRLLQFLPLEPKKYEFSVCFGKETDTLDREGTVVHSEGRIPDGQEIENVLAQFTGELMQAPPRYSSVKIQGQRAYKLARKNVDFTPGVRPTTVYSLELSSYDAASAVATLRVDCSSGTYVRSLARDIGRALGTFSYAGSVHRTAAGHFSLNDAVGAEELEEDGKVKVVSVAQAFSSFPSVCLTPEQRNAVAQGRTIALHGAGGHSRIFAYDSDNEIVAVVELKDDGHYQPVRVFI